MGKILLIVAVVLSGLLCGLTSCGDSGCTESTSSLPIAGFYSYATLGKIQIDSISVGGVGAPGDSLIIKNRNGVSEVYLPLRSMHSSTSFFFRYNSKALDFPQLIDTLTLSYESTPYFAGAECGAMFRYKINGHSCTRHLIDSVGLVSSEVTNDNAEIIRIYFRTSQPE